MKFGGFGRFLGGFWCVKEVFSPFLVLFRLNSTLVLRFWVTFLTGSTKKRPFTTLSIPMAHQKTEKMVLEGL